MPHFTETRVPPGTSRRWEVLLSDDPPRPVASHWRSRSALEVRAEHRVLRGFSDADLHRIPLVAQGATLGRRARYLDLHDPARADFVAEGDEVVEPGQHVVASADVPSEIWEQLLDACDDVLGRGPFRLRQAV